MGYLSYRYLLAVNIMDIEETGGYGNGFYGRIQVLVER